MCCCHHCMIWHHPHHRPRHAHHIHFPWPVMDIEEEIELLEDYKEALEKELEKVKRRLETLRGRMEKRE